MENIEEIEDISESKPKKSKKILKIFFIIIPLILLLFFYINNKTFKTKVDTFLSRLPGTAGEYFRNSPTDNERQMMKSELADYYLSLEPGVAADKLYIIKKEDDKLYQDIIKLMNSISSTKTIEIIENVRKIELRRNLLVSIYDEIQLEKENFIMDEAGRFEGRDLFVVINEIEKRYANNQEFRDNLPNIISYMDENSAIDILFYINDDIREEILYSLNSSKRTSLENKLLSKRAEQIKLEELAKLYESKSTELAVQEIGNTEKYTIEELATIYKNLSVLKSAEILSSVEDEEFIQELLTAIKTEGQLLGEENITEEIGKSMAFITEYNDKVDNLVSIYEKMQASKVAKIAEKMMGNNSTVTMLEINAEPVFEISDASIMMDVLSRIGNKTLANIMNSMNDRKASTLTQKLAKPTVGIGEISTVEGDTSAETITEYSKKTDDLVSVYENMNPSKAAKIVDDMIKNNTTAPIIADILSKMQDKNLSNIMNNMEPKEASKLTQMLVR
jgi:flagellar motility protein MotE (MotC chaperone)